MSAERWASRNFILGSILATAFIMVAVAGATNPRVNPTGPSAGISPFALMSAASAKLPVENWGPQAF
jgi:hypothetical protein